MPASLADWLAAAPKVDTDWHELRQVYRRSLVDLAALRFYPESVPDSSLPAAGLPWFMALFGRDSLITSYQAIPFVPELARTTLLALGAHQATEWDDFRDAEPGKILHELRHGELAHFGERPHSPYFGSADATPLFLVVLDEYERWTGDAETVRAAGGRGPGGAGVDGALRRPRRRRLHRVPDPQPDDRAGQPVLEGLVELDRPPRRPAGHAARGPAARSRGTPTTRGCGRPGWPARSGTTPALADRLERDAAALRAQFDRDFWLPDAGFYALALDGDKKPVPTLTSNIGHLLWSGIVADERVEAVVAHLTGEHMFSGWGVRTLADGQPVYNPIEYHNGTVWPHDTALIAAGLARYGRRQEANRLAVALLEAAGALRVPAAGGLRRLPAADDPGAGGVPDAPARRRPGRPARRCCCCASCWAWSRPRTA